MDLEGRVLILGRYKDLIISGGENISPLKVERVLDACKGVQKVSCTIPQSFAATDTPARRDRRRGRRSGHREERASINQQL
jgi:acyl-CoA synthetase (AMP-forming)/AMP-acid ligase II